ncbi:uncharacterized protein LOC100121612 [Nasonia vitripennis]|uniref:Uncharacterized protein n=1 Tax=Nasonia vitripennis TaxID=7425 RepID=A0A7M7T7M5_NASVI|nr:uncharacterized protein LOC100121612 [Nasonia vitripennis]XP_016837697.1 uncharacterized protein LOC100121612 [Nasonia vitripennis]XP_016837698.1 uncharacterized protein LOC100121612 [Nasonia vitripennis]XP_031780394.1 uncharacterized protein LOC100121612 [Nasonia vitripennis]XP_031780395.1 uncharacterized protein LOC100121612 [Nasonia vitripennis]
MRRQSFSSSLSSGSGGAGEPLIVVEESTLGEEEAERRRNESPPRCLDPDSPSLNPYLLSPWREARKHSLPTPQCTSGITASQVRRLSERGGEGSGPSPREAAFLATLSQSTPPQPGGRRHSVVTISRVPPTLFGRNRRESIAAFPMGGATRILGSRRESASGLASGPPSNSGSTHNLQLDIMDDIAEIKAARKVRLKMWKTPSHERVCEVQPLEGNGSGTQRYTQYQQRRYSDFALTTIPSLPTPGGAASTRRRASEMPPRPPLITGPPPPVPPRSGLSGLSGAPQQSGIVCTNTDLISILSSLTSSATEINRCGAEDEKDLKQAKTIEQKRNRLKSSRSNSFDVSILHGCGDGKQASTAALLRGLSQANNASVMSPSSWFVKRHQPMAKKQRSVESPSVTLSFKFEKSRMVKAVKDSLAKTSPTKDELAGVRHKVVWDDTSGTKVDAQVLGNAIEEFLRSGVTGESSEASESSSNKSAISPSGKPLRGSISAGPAGKVAAWFTGGNASSAGSATSGTGNAGKEDEQTDSCEPSICSSLKDLFVK